MATNLSTHLPIIPVSTISGNQEQIFNFLEGATQVFNIGTPIKMSAGAVIAATLVNSTNLVVGISAYPGHNLASAGKGASPVFGSIGFPGGAPTFGTVINQPAAVNILHGSPFVDGLMPTYLAVQDTIFEVQVDNSTTATFNATTTAIGQWATISVDASNFWYLDLNTVVAAPSATTSVLILSLNPQDLVVGSTTTQVNNGRVRVRFQENATQTMQ